LTLDRISCDDFIHNYACDFNDFKNSLHWIYPDSCGDDVSYFKLFYFPSQGTDSAKLAATVEFNFVHHLQNSFAGCYSILAVDRAGNEGPISNRICNDNCPNVFIPNVFTPANGDGYNDSFPGFSGTSKPEMQPSLCPRFLKSMDMKIFNRWGEEVYLINTASQPSAEWKGQDLKGNELPAGIYYYSADLVFDTMDQHSRNQFDKGWISLIR
jgi:gliding motility-associated-like protein